VIDPEYGYLEPQVDGTWTYATDLVYGAGDLENNPSKTDDELVTDWINKIAVDSGTTVVIETLSGRGGGWPSVIFQGDHDHIENLIKRLSTEAPTWTRS